MFQEYRQSSSRLFPENVRTFRTVHILQVFVPLAPPSKNPVKCQQAHFPPSMSSSWLCDKAIAERLTVFDQREQKSSFFAICLYTKKKQRRGKCQEQLALFTENFKLDATHICIIKTLCPQACMSVSLVNPNTWETVKKKKKAHGCLQTLARHRRHSKVVLPFFCVSVNIY